MRTRSVVALTVLFVSTAVLTVGSTPAGARRANAHATPADSSYLYHANFNLTYEIDWEIRQGQDDGNCSPWTIDRGVNLVVVHVIYGLGFTTLFFRNYYATFPSELIKAAMMDGASFFQIFRRILLPNSTPIFIVTVIYQFTNIWNDFLFGSTFAAGDSAPMTVALNNLVNTSTGVVEYNTNMAAAIIAAAPTLFVYVIAGRYFVRGLMAGAVKG